MKKFSLILMFLLLLPVASPLVAQQDVDGSADHPLISRYPGSRIGWCDVQEFDRYKIAVSWLPAIAILKIGCRLRVKSPVFITSCPARTALQKCI
ncbi:MAG: hypothetical protein H6629_13260 [Calditrichae bacterium]|nr:hypothetical protein [Calditrichia bacterium]